MASHYALRLLFWRFVAHGRVPFHRRNARRCVARPVPSRRCHARRCIARPLEADPRALLADEQVSPGLTSSLTSRTARVTIHSAAPLVPPIRTAEPSPCTRPLT